MKINNYAWFSDEKEDTKKSHVSLFILPGIVLNDGVQLQNIIQLVENFSFN